MVTSSVKLVRPLGEGGMGSVWLAEHQALHTQVVVKFIAAEYTTSKEALARFSREAAAASQVKSPHVVQTLDHGVTSEGLPYIVMEYLEGRDLEHHLEQMNAQGSRMTPVEVSEVVSQLSRALEKAHAVGIVHRDIKPANIFFCDAGDGALFVKLLDFGIAKGMNIPLLDSGTRTGTMIGSPYYMSPEQLVGAKDVDHRTDLWSVGVVAFEMLTGRRAFEAETVGALALMIHNDPVPLPSQVSPELAPLDEWFMRACAKKPEERYASAKEMADRLSAAVNGRKTHNSFAPPPGSQQSPNSITGPGSRRSTDGFTSGVGNAKTMLDPKTDPRNRTDAGLGVQAPPRSNKGRTAGIAIAAIVGLGVAAFGLVKFGQSRVTPDPSTTNGANLVQSANIGTTAQPLPVPGGSGASTPGSASTTTSLPVGSAPPAASSAPALPSSAVPYGAGSGKVVRPTPSHKPVTAPSSTSPKRPGDDIY